MLVCRQSKIYEVLLRMKFVSYKLKEHETVYRIGCLNDEYVLDVQESYREYLLSHGAQRKIDQIDELLPADPSEFFALGKVAIDRAKEGYTFVNEQANRGAFFVEREQVRFGTPLPKPEKIICVGRNYKEHAVEMESDVPEAPVLFAKFANALIGPDDAIEKPTITDQLDYEVELGIVMGQQAKNVKKSDAYDYIAGYTIGNDITARDLQKRTPQWLQGKTLDRTTPIGPWIITADEVPNPDSLAVRSYVNGEERQNSNTSKFIFDIPTLIEYISKIVTLQPGDIILTGTPDGVGVAMDPPEYLQDGDVVSLYIDGIGRLENKVVEID